MSIIDLTIPGIPLSQKRHQHRYFEKGKFIKTYDPSVFDKQNFLFKAIYDNKPSRPISRPICLEIIFYMPRIKSHYRTGKNSDMLKENAPLVHSKKPDLDNLVKFVLDALNKIYWVDDAQIYSMRAGKLYDLYPRTEIQITWEPS
jgi:Holliday junction resolvase RusA-like endonuclease